MAEELKHWFDTAFFEDLGGALSHHLPDFDRHGFTRTTTDGLGHLELKQRMTRTVDACRIHLPDDYRQAVGGTSHRVV